MTWLSALRTLDAGPAMAELRGDWRANAVQVVLAHGGRMGRASAQAFDAGFESGPMLADHAERALRCAQALLAQAQADADAATRHGLPVGASLRLGVHLAPIGLAADAETDTDTDSDPIAAQAAAIARSAPPGRLCVSHDVFCGVRLLFDAEPPRPLVVEGRSDPLQTFLLRDATWQPAGDTEARTDVTQMPLVGRQNELRSLQAAFERAVGGGHASAITVLAAPGIGKSRLLREFGDWAQAQPVPVHFLHARAMPQARAQPFGLLGQLLRGFCRIGLDCPPDVARSRLEAAIVPWFLAADGADAANAADAADVATQPLVHAFGRQRQAAERFILEAVRRKGERGAIKTLADLRRVLQSNDFIALTIRLSTGNQVAAITLVVVAAGALLSFGGGLSLGTFSAFILLLPKLLQAVTTWPAMPRT